jgi:uncharacterized protein YjbI with pentapeptide repeats
LTENDLSADASLVADPERGVVVDFLESPTAPTPDQDTAGVGVDVIPYAYTRTANNTFCWDDADPEAAHFMTLIDSGGAEILRLQANGACVTAGIEPGQYTLRIVHDDRSAETLPVFIEVVNGASSATLKAGLVRTAGRLLADTMGGLGFAQPAVAQPPVDTNVDTLLHTNRCPGCRLEFANLAKASLSGADLSGATLAGANLSEAILRKAQLPGASLVQSTLTGADLSEASVFDADLTRANLRGAKLGLTNLFRSHLPMADLEGAVLTNAELEEADLTRANLVGADLYSAGLIAATLVDANLTNADLTYAYMCRANLNGANLTGADLSYARFGGTGRDLCHTCAPGSIGQCTPF